MAPQHRTARQSGKTLAECMRYMLDYEISTDVCFEVGPPDGETVTFRAHKYMLIARSEVFEAMFSSGMAECSGPEAKVRVEDIDTDIFKELLNYMYCERASMCPKSALYLMHAAKKYMLPKLVEECCKCVLNSLDANNVIHFLEQSFHFDHQEIQRGCLELISVNAKAVLTGAEILSASRQAMEAILGAKTMSVRESVIYETTVNWAKHQLQIAMPGKNPADRHIREALGDLLYKIHFPAMKPTEFAEISAKSNILSADEKDSIYYYIATKRDRHLKFPTEQRIGEEIWIDRTVTCVSKSWRSTPNVDAINFTTDQDILLTGIGLYTGYTERGYDVDVEILQSINSLFKKRVTVPYSGNATPFKIVIDEPIVIPAGVLYSVKALSHHYIGHFGQLCQAACTKERVTFTFAKHSESKYTNETYGQIPQLYFCYL